MARPMYKDLGPVGYDELIYNIDQTPDAVTVKIAASQGQLKPAQKSLIAARCWAQLMWYISWPKIPMRPRRPMPPHTVPVTFAEMASTPRPIN